jgi:NTE family protein
MGECRQRMRGVCAVMASAVFAVLAGCATQVFNSPTNEPLAPSTPPDMGARTDVMRENSIVLSLSGGGLRAAAFAHGVLSALQSLKTPDGDGDLLDDVAMMSSVSGSSLTAAYYGLYGREGLARFRQDVLLADFESGMRLSLFSPTNLFRIFGGGLNSREDFRDRLDRAIFHGATFGDLYRRARPEIRIQATDLYYRVPFPFLPALFEILCSDLSRYSIADAVAASMAVPVLFAPVVVRTYPESCKPLDPETARALARIRSHGSRTLGAIAKATAAYNDRSRTHYIKLADGGLTDNFAVSTLSISRLAYGTPYAPMTDHDAVHISRLLVVVVDASHRPSGDWDLREAGPTGLDLALSGTDAAVESAARYAADALGNMMQEWQDAVIAFRCSLSPAEVKRLGGPPRWNCRDVKFSYATLSIDQMKSPLRERIGAIPTRLTLSPAQIDAAFEGGRSGLLALPELRLYLKDRARPERGEETDG